MIQGRFPTTRLTLILRSGSEDTSVRRNAFDGIVLAYWKPAYKYVRLKWNVTQEDAEDLVQTFFALSMEKGYFSKYKPDKARFRTFLLQCLKGFLSKANRDANRQKRGGDVVHVPLDFETAEGELRERELPVDFDPEELFYQEWVRQLLASAADDTRKRLMSSGKQTHWEIFQRYDIEDSAEARPTYQDLARQLSIPVTQVTNYLTAARREYRAAVLDRLRSATNSDEEFQAELERLFRAEIH